MMRVLGLSAVLLLFAACQTYDFERVVPLAVAQTTDRKLIASKRLKPNVMLLVDNSGSMNFPTNPLASGCPTGCGTGLNLCPGTCPTRVSELKNAMASFLQTSGTIARLGLTIFPTPMGLANGISGCDPSTSLAEPFPAPTANDDDTDAALQAVAQSINQRVQALSPNGGTPTAGSLDFVGSTGGLNDQADFRDDFVLLLTDGLPNCNGANPNNICGCGASCSSTQTMACSCTTGSCSGADPVRSTCAKGCLDRDGAVASVRALRQKGIRTIVVGFGADLASGDGPVVLNAMAREGGFARDCKNGTDAECGGTPGSCNTATQQCSTSFFQAANGAELSAALRKISESIQGDPCEFELSARPSEPQYLSVIVNDQSLAPSATTYNYELNSNKVIFNDPVCAQLKASTTQNPINVEFRIVERF